MTRRRRSPSPRRAAAREADDGPPHHTLPVLDRLRAADLANRCVASARAAFARRKSLGGAIRAASIRRQRAIPASVPPKLSYNGRSQERRTEHGHSVLDERPARITQRGAHTPRRRPRRDNPSTRRTAGSTKHDAPKEGRAIRARPSVHRPGAIFRNRAELSSTWLTARREPPRRRDARPVQPTRARDS